jgi:TPR repeat protein
MTAAIKSKPLLVAPRKSAARLFLDLYLGGSGFRGFVDFAVIGGIVLAFIHGIQPIVAGLSSFASSRAGVPPPAQAAPKDKNDIAKIGLRNNLLAPRLSELGLNETNFDRVDQPLRSQLVAAWRLYRDKKPVEAVELLRNAPDDPHVLLVRGLATMAQPHNGAFRDGVAMIEQAAGKADPKSLAVLGVLHIAGVPGLQRDLEKGQKLLLQAAAAGDVDASRVAGEGFLSGWMGSVDPARAARYFRFAIDKGDAKSTFRLAVMLMAGTGVKKDEIEADRLAESAATAGIREAQTTVGMRKLTAYMAGLTDETGDALKWLNLAADQDEPMAMRFLATFYMSLGARTGQVNLVRGNEILRRCVERTGDKACALAYGEAINLGTAEPRDPKKAYAMFMLANRDGGTAAVRSKLEELGKELTRADIVDAQMMASQLSVIRE